MGNMSFMLNKTRSVRMLAIAFAAATAVACASPEQRVEKYYESGQEYLEKGELGKANVQFQNVLKIDETHVPALLGIAQIAERKKDFKAMFGIYQKVERLAPDNGFAHVQLGKLYLLGSDETAALEQAEKALAINPDDPDAITLKAGVLLRLGDNTGAVELARNVLNAHPANPEAAVVIATSKVQSGDFDGGLDELDRALEADPKIAVLQLLRIRLLAQMNREQDVAAAFDNLVKLFPEEPAYRRAYAAEFIGRKAYGQAVAQLEEVVRLEPENNNAKIDVVRLIKADKGAAEAEAKLRDYVEAEPNNTELKFTLVDFLTEQRSWAAATAELEPLSRSKDQSTEFKAKNTLAAIHIANGERQQAEVLIEEILSEDENNTDALLKSAGFQIEDGEFDTAVANLRTVLNNNPDQAEAMVLMATAFERQDNLDFATAEYAKAFDASGKDAKITNLYAKFLMRHDNARRAEEVLVQSLAAHPNDLENLKLLAATRLALQDWTGADEVASAIEKLDRLGDDEVVRNIRTVAFSGLGDYDQLINLLSSEKSGDLQETRPLAALVGAYVRSERIDDAEALLQDVLASNDKNYNAYLLLAQVKALKNDSAGAEQALLNAAEADPSRVEVYESLYRFYTGRDRDDDAKALIERGLAAAPDSDPLRFYMADIHLREGRLEEALDIYSDLVEKRPENKIIANNFVSLSSELRLDEASIKRAAEVAKILEGESNANIQDTVGWAFYRDGQLERALDYLTRAAAGAPDNAEVLYHLGVVEFGAGTDGKWQATLNKALEAGGENFRFASEIRTMLERQ